MNRGIHSRGYLPHWDFKNSVQGITFRLIDSVPKDVILKWKRELVSIEDEVEREAELHRKIARYEDAGMGECLLADPVCAAVIRDEDHYYSSRSYIRRNPLKAHLCENPEDWEFSSAWNGARTLVRPQEPPVAD